VLRIAYPFLPVFFGSADEETSAGVSVTFDFAEDDTSAGNGPIQIGS
jgi:hypothetical protein